MTTTTWLRLASKHASKRSMNRGAVQQKAGLDNIQMQGRRYFNKSAATSVAATDATSPSENDSPVNLAAAAVMSTLLLALGVSSSCSIEEEDSHRDDKVSYHQQQRRHDSYSHINYNKEHSHSLRKNVENVAATRIHRAEDLVAKYLGSSTISRIVQPQVCSCDSAASMEMATTTVDEDNQQQQRQKKKKHRRSPRTSFLQRYRTIRRMAIHSTKKSLETRYQWNKSDVLGKGAFGDVYLAYDKLTPTPHEKVALKKISKVYTDDESFQREMRALLHVRDNGGHPHVCALRENYDEDDFYYLILDYIEGGEMFDHLINNGAYSERDAARLVREVADSLSFCHGIGLVHADLKPENILLSTTRRGDSVVKLVDFGCSQVLEVDDIGYDDNNEHFTPPNAYNNAGGQSSPSPLLSRQRSLPKPSYECPTPAYCPPELLNREQPIGPTMDVWALGVILYIMLTGAHPFDLEGNASDELIVQRIQDKNHKLPIRNSVMTSHLSDSAIDLIEKLMNRDPNKRLTALEMLEHPWIRGETATSDIIAGSDQRLSKFRVMKTKLQAKFFQDAVNWSDHDLETLRKTSLIERSFHSLDTDLDGYLDMNDFGQLERGGKDAAPPSSAPSSLKSVVQDHSNIDAGNVDESRGPTLSMSDFQHLLTENIKQRYFPAGHVVYRENDVGDHMYFINSGTIEVTTKDGSRAVRRQGDFFGEGALLHPQKLRSATIRCRTPVNVMEISREYFEKYLAKAEVDLYLTLREKDKIRKKNRAKTILGLQSTLIPRNLKEGEFLFRDGDVGDSLYILESGRVDIESNGKQVFSVMPGNVFGEHAVITGRRRNCSAFCATEEGCSANELTGRDYRKLVESSPNVDLSLRDLLLRREFKKAVVSRMKKGFPYHNPREAFDAADENRLGVLDKESIGRIMRDLDPAYTDKEVEDIIEALNLTNSGTVSFDEFKKVFVGNIRTSASM